MCTCEDHYDAVSESSAQFALRNLQVSADIAVRLRLMQLEQRGST
jgi:hypothetical protein